jgi:hypothetical protein
MLIDFNPHHARASSRNEISINGTHKATIKKPIPHQKE